MNKFNLNYEISNQDIEDVLPNTRIIKYSDLANYSHITQLLPKSFSYVVILTETKPSTGHWTTLTRNNNIITYFDSYGKVEELQYISPLERIELHENHPYLSK
jgi:hypothetical protein